MCRRFGRSSCRTTQGCARQDESMDSDLDATSGTSVKREHEDSAIVKLQGCSCVRKNSLIQYVPGIVLVSTRLDVGESGCCTSPLRWPLGSTNAENVRFLRLTLLRHEYTLGNDDNELAAVGPHGKSVETLAHHERELVAAGVA